jgi:hypothetical protein
VKALAARLGGDCKRAYEVVETLAASGPLEREDGRVSTADDVITAEMRPLGFPEAAGKAAVTAISRKTGPGPPAHTRATAVTRINRQRHRPRPE